MLSVGLLPATAGAQHRADKHHGDRQKEDRHGGEDQRNKTDAQPEVVVEQPVVRSTTVKPAVIGPSVVVKQPMVAGWTTSESPVRPGFGSMPVRTGFGSMPVRTGFGPAVEMALPDQTRGTHVQPTRPRHGRSSKSFRGAQANHGIAVIFVPVPYSYAYEPPFGGAASPASHPSPFESRFGTRNRVGVTAGPSTYWIDVSSQAGASAGLAFDVEPAQAEVYVDDVYAGVVQDFATGRDPLMVVPGTHRIELRAPGYHPVSLDVTIVAGQVIPFSGELDPLRSY